MLSWHAAELLTWLQSNWGWAAGLAASMMGLTALAGLLNRQRKDEVALWLMGAHTETGWARSFTTLFDAVFGRRHLSLRCFLRSAAASLVAVIVIWLLMGSAETIGVRLRADLTLGSVLILGLAINVAADYVSLLETRLLLAHMPRRTLAQAGVLILDLLLSAAIIWLAIFAFLRSPLHQGEIESFAEILGVFSIFSVFFYSTFLTSVWTWAYIASTWLMRLAKRLRLADWLDVEHRPILILSNVLGLVTFLGAIAVSGPLTLDEEGLTAADRTLCAAFKGRVCLDIAGLTPAKESQLNFLILACDGATTRECITDGVRVIGEESIDSLLLSVCTGGNIEVCALIAYGPEAAQIFEELCGGGEDLADIACGRLGYMLEQGRGIDRDTGQAARLLKRGCDSGDNWACTALGSLYLARVRPDLDEAIRMYDLACDGGDAVGCSNLASLRAQGIGAPSDATEADRLFSRACELGDDRACRWPGTSGSE